VTASLREWSARPDGEHSVVTGGAGFIGSNLAEALLRAGGTVTVFDDLSRQGSERNLAWLDGRHHDRVRFVRGDVRDAARVEEVVTGADVVYHLAGQTAVTTSVVDPRGDFEANLLGTFNVLEAARRSPVQPIVVYASTNKVYGSLEHTALVEHATRHDFADLAAGIDETQPLDPQSPYGCSKASAELYVRDYHRLYGLRTIAFRQSCIYGPRQLGVEEQGWVAWFIRAAVRGEEITIFGDGKQVRDLLYVDDLIDVYLRAVDRIEMTAGQVYNIGGGRARTLSVWREFGPLLSEILQRHLDPARQVAARPSDQKVFYCDVAKAERDLGWHANVGLEEGLAALTASIRAEART
jgi:CDP-paratose 2-epimerase